MRRGVGQNVSEGARAYGRGYGLEQQFYEEISYDRAQIAQFFVDLRRGLRLTLPQIAAYLRVNVDSIEHLESGRVELLPNRRETAQFILDYASLAQIDGRPLLSAIGGLVAKLERYSALGSSSAVVQETVVDRSGRTLRRAGSALANGAMRLPKGAMDQVRRRPDRAFYALSLPLALLLIGFNSGAIAQVSRPFSLSVEWFSGYFQEHFGRLQGGLRYIEVEDPRSRRADMLPVKGGS